ncbi:MAG: MFS transporter, partial [Pseudomonadota bacterium]
MLGRLRGDWPFPAARAPFYYGWVIAAVSTLGFLFSIPGQTMGMAVFSDEFIRVFGLTRTELSLAYLFGTVGSALLLTRAGRWYDRYGARVMLVGASVALGATLLLISGMDHLGYALAAAFSLPVAWFSFPLILLGYFGVRFSGQGVLTSASRNVLLVWFEKRRGFVTGLRGVFVSLGFSLAPLLLALLIDAFGWRGALWCMAALVGLGFAGLALLMVRDQPAVSGLEIDGRSAEQPRLEPRVGSDQTLAQVRRDPVFWMYAASLSMHALFGTAVTFHILAIFAEAGRSREAAFAYFLPQAIVSLTTNLTASAAADYIRLKPLLIAMLLAFILGAYGLTQ